MKTKIANFQEVTINHLMSHIAAQKAFMNMKHPDLKNISDNEENNSQWGFFPFFCFIKERKSWDNFVSNGNHKLIFISQVL